jgi:hypothetical protein
VPANAADSTVINNKDYVPGFTVSQGNSTLALQRVKFSNNTGLFVDSSQVRTAGLSFATLESIEFQKGGSLTQINTQNGTTYADSPDAYKAVPEVWPLKPLSERAANVTWLSAKDQEFKDIQAVCSLIAGTAQVLQALWPG